MTIGKYLTKTRQIKRNIIIHRFTAKHGVTYGYDEVEYSGRTGLVTILCYEHGTFSQRADHHANGSGCPKCNGGTAKTLGDAILSFKEAHGEVYDYSKVQYKTARIPVIVGCSIHGPFLVTPDNHTRGNGCPACKGRSSNVLYLHRLRETTYKLGVTSSSHGAHRLSQIANYYKTPLDILRYVVVDRAVTYEKLLKELLSNYKMNSITIEAGVGYTEIFDIPDSCLPAVLEFYDTIGETKQCIIT